MSTEVIWQIGSSLGRIPKYSLKGNAWLPVFDYFIDQDPDPVHQPGVPRYLTMAGSVRKVGPGTGRMRIHFTPQRSYSSADFVFPNVGLIKTRFGMKVELSLDGEDLGEPKKDKWSLGALERREYVLEWKVVPARKRPRETPINLAFAKLEGVMEEARPDVVIASVNYDGEVSRVESDEYVEIINQGDADAELSGWQLHADDRGQDFLFPEGTVLAPGQRLRVYTDEVHPETGGFSYGSKRAIWNNRGDDGQLFDLEGNLVSHYAYGKAAERQAQDQALDG